MQITVNHETNGTELYHLSILFQSLAKAQGFVAPVEQTQCSMSQTTTVGEVSVKLTVDTTDATAAVEALAALAAKNSVDVVELPPATYSVSELGNVESSTVQTTGTASIAPPSVNVQVPDAGATDPNLDSAGLPWDARIHAGSRERNTDGSWRVRRKPKDTDQEEWNATLARVTAELHDLMEIPVSTGAVADAAAEEALTDAEVDTFVDIVQGVTEKPLADYSPDDVTVVMEPIAPPATVTPPVVAPPVTIAPPVTAVAPPIAKVETFAQVMTFLTARTPKDEAAKPAMVAKVNEILAANGLTVLTQLGQRPELIPQVMVEFSAAFGE